MPAATARDVIKGSTFNDIIWGDSNGNSDANDNGQDILSGGDGNDVVHGGNGKDEVNGDAGNDKLFGDNGEDVVNGGSGADELYGGNGNDKLTGGLGGDLLWGDNGADRFIFVDAAESAATAGAWTADADWIKDFSNTEGDKIDLAGLNNELTGSGPSMLTWSGNAPAQHGVWFVSDADDGDVDDGYGVLYADLDGVAGAEAAIKVNGVTGNSFIGVNHAPAASLSPASQSYTDTSAVDDFTTAGGTFSASDPDAGDSVTLSLAGSSPLVDPNFNQQKAGTYGTLYFNSLTGAYSYVPNDAAINALQVGDTPSESFTFTATDSFGAADSKTLTISFTGANDAPVATLTPASASYADTAAADDFADAPGTFSATDVDGGAPTLALSGSSASVALGFDQQKAGTYGTLYLNSSSGAYKYVPDDAAIDALEDGAIASETFTLTATDSHGASDSKTLTINLTGANDAAIFGDDDTGSVTEDGTLIATGLLTVNDVDGADTIQADTLGGDYGSLTIDAAGNWTYTLDNTDSDLATLHAGEQEDEVFTVKSADGTTHNITVTVHGANDAPAYTPPPVYTGGGDPNDFDSLTGGAESNDATINGTNDPNVLTGGSSGQNIDGKPGADTIYGRGGDDTINGDGGGDTLYGQAGGDTISGNNENDLIYGGSGDDTIVGGNQVDTIYGGSGADTITGSNGDDVIIGGYGADILFGAGDDDTFKFLSNLDTGDTISDFNAGDKIDLSAFALSSFVGVLGSAGAVGINEVGYRVAGGITTVYVDSNGVAGADLEIHLTGSHSLVLGDFVL